MEGVFLFFSRGDALTADTAVEGHSSHLLTSARQLAAAGSGSEAAERGRGPSAIWGPHVGVSRSLAACDWRARLVFLAKHLMDHRCGVSDVPH